MARKGLVRPIILFLALFLAVLIHGELTIELNGAGDLQNIILITIDGRDECVSVSDIFHSPYIATDKTRRSRGRNSTSSKKTIESVDNAVVVTYNVESGIICDQGYRHIVTMGNTNKKNQEQSKTTISRLNVFGLCLGYSQNRSITSSLFESNQVEDNVTVLSETGTLAAHISLDAIPYEELAVYPPEIQFATYAVSSHSIHFESRSNQKKPLSIKLDGQQVSVYDVGVESNKLEIDLGFGLRRQLASEESVPIDHFGIGIYDHSAEASEALVRDGETDSLIQGHMGGSLRGADASEHTKIEAPLDHPGPTGTHDIFKASIEFEDTPQSASFYGIGGEEKVDSIGSNLNTPGTAEVSNNGKMDGEIKTHQNSLQDPSLSHASVCSALNECCRNSDCSTADQICVGYRCVIDGNPRFTLTWTGDDDLDLIVETPNGAVLSFDNLYDPDSGGKVGEPVDQGSLGFQVENIYFPLSGGPQGIYNYYVRPLSTNNGPDFWTLRVSDNGVEVAAHSGNKFSDRFTYYRGGRLTNPPILLTRPPTSPPVRPTSPPVPPTNRPDENCSPLSNECCRNSDCFLHNEICVNRNCINDGNPRFTLQWTGDDDLDLFVRTPGGQEISFERLYDPESGGRFGEESDQFGLDYHVENIYFPTAGSPMGTYTFFVRPLFNRGDSMDEWIVSVADNGREVYFETGTGISEEFTYFRDRPTPAPIAPITRPTPTTGPPVPRPTLPSPTESPVVIPTRPPSPTRPSIPTRPTFPTMPTVPTSPSFPTRPPFPTATRPPFPTRPAVPTRPTPIRLPTRAPSILTKEPTRSVPTRVPIRIPTPAPIRTLPPQIQECSVFFDECCEDSDCPTSRDVCEQRTCLRHGNPRFTLTWTGNDDLDLYVITPDGDEISVGNPFDQSSGGTFQQDIDQSTFGLHVESIYFPILGTAQGDYIYGARLSTGRGDGNDFWTIDIYEDGELVTSTIGSGEAGPFTYDREAEFDGPQRPRPTPPRCNPVSDECCQDSDCFAEGEICVQRTCIDEGNPRFTLEWIGDDDLELYVETPQGTTIFNGNPFCPISGGRFGEESEQTTFGFNVENIYFPIVGTDAGRYRYFVTSTETRGFGADIWTVRVFENGEEVETQTGIGDSRQFVYERLIEFTSSPAPTPGPLVDCTTNVDECCDNRDCTNVGEICVQRTCIDTGFPRFTLTWTGDDDLDLYVESPDGIMLFYGNQFDPATGGEYGEDFSQPGLGFHVENVFYPALGAPYGSYKYYVLPAAQRGPFVDSWDLSVFEGATLVSLQKGTGKSDVFLYERIPNTFPTPAPSIFGECSTTTSQCCQDKDCNVNDDELCVQRSCINNGNPRITLTWTGDDDLDLSVTTPDGFAISARNPIDKDSGGEFQGGSDSDLQVENVFFPTTGGPDGAYVINIGVSSQIGEADSWTLSVFEDSMVVLRRTGTGKSAPITYIRDSSIMKVPTPTRPTPSIRPTPAKPTSSPGPTRPTTPPKPTFTPKPTPPIRPTPTRPTPTDTSQPVSVSPAMPVPTVPGPLPTPERPPPVLPLPPTRPCPHECCSDNDCLVPSELCVQRTCINEGLPRFTLTWTGNDDYSLIVVTPNGDMISYLNPFDTLSGGIFGEDDQQNQFGFHVENVFFPQSGGPPGLYSYFVRSFTARGDDDRWTLRVWLNGELAVWNTGTGESRTYTFLFDGTAPVPTPTFPTPTFRPFPTPTFPTPTFRPFPTPTFPTPTFRPFPTPTFPTPTFPTPTFPTPTFRPFPTPTFPVPTPTVPNPTLPTTCQLDSDCQGAFEICVQRTCIDEGNPRFTLTWSGNDDLNLIVITPLGTTVSATNPVDSSTGGIFGEPGQQLQFGLHVENIFFPIQGGPFGTYYYFVQSANAIGSNDRWMLTVYVGGEAVAAQTGTGPSFRFNYDFGPFTLMPGTESPTTAKPEKTPSPTSRRRTPAPTRLKPTETPMKIECFRDFDCEDTEICVGQTCIDNGNPRVTLTWTGDDDLDLFVETPLGNTISVYRPLDVVSGGIFGEPGRQEGFGTYVENIFFPGEGGPVGTYNYYVQSFNAVERDDRWTISVFVDGEEIASQSGAGGSSVFSFDFGMLTPAPTLSPIGACISEQEECCDDADCIFGIDVCVQRTCIAEGNPRFTLTWTGDDDLDLVVRTPLGTIISFVNEFDSESGGVFGEVSDQFEFGSHVENIFFPLTGGPIGTYSYFVRSFLPERSDDLWTVSVFVQGEEVATNVGTGTSQELLFDFGMLQPTPAPPSNPGRPTKPPTSVPTPDFKECDITTEECCSDAQCITNFEVCVQRTCIDRGNPRFTLVWTGDDDLDLLVETPLGTSISFTNPVDPASGGVYGEEGAQFFSDMHVENVFFPIGGGPSGVYSYSVKSYNAINGDDRWTATVYVNDREISSQSGFGDSAVFTFDFFEGMNMAFPTPSPLSECSTEVDECCFDVDCLNRSEICVQRTCIDRGNPRFTLTWTGDDDLDLTVVTPVMTTVNVANPEDNLSQGVFGELGDQFGFGMHVENIYFPQGGGPTGTYTYYVSSFFPSEADDAWTLRVFVDDEEVASHTGVGTSSLLLYDFDGGDTSAPIGCNSEVDECCDTSECPNTNVCVQRQCVDEGNPRFTLTWTGDDDLDIIVTPPVGQTISFFNPADDQSGGAYGEYGVQFFFGMHVENIYFPFGGPLGTYEFEVLSLNPINDDDLWIVDIYVDGEQVDSATGLGDSGKLSFTYPPDPNMPTSDQMSEQVVTDSGFQIGICSSFVDECCSDVDCDTTQGQICVQRICIVEGNPRFTLTWTGDDDLDLSVETPLETIISSTNPSDAETGGMLGQPSDQLGIGLYVENIYFPMTDAPSGTYTYTIRSFQSVGQDDEWTVQVFVDGQEVASDSGIGDSEPFIFQYNGVSSSFAETSNVGETKDLCTTQVDECCLDSDCTAWEDNSICIDRMCLREGKVRFTLKWDAGNSKNQVTHLTVITPDWKSLSTEDKYIEDSGIWQESHDNALSGGHIKSVGFENPSKGRYTYIIGNPPGSENTWTMNIYVDGVEVESRTDSGKNLILFFEYY